MRQAAPAAKRNFMSEAAPPERRLFGIALRATSATAFGLMAAFLKTASQHGVSTFEMIFYRNIWALLVVGSWIALGPGWSAVKTKAPLAHITRSVIGSSGGNPIPTNRRSIACCSRRRSRHCAALT